MRPVKITIYGDFIDCQIYRGRLYLWTFDGNLKVYNWSELVESFIKKDIDRVAFTFCFLDGNYLYKTALVDLFKDEEFNSLLVSKFDRVTKNDYELTSKKADHFLIGQQETPAGEVPTDTEIYGNKLYFITETGLYVGAAHRSSQKYPVSSRPSKLWDCNLLAIKANKYPQLALSGGDEGLFEFNMTGFKKKKLKEIEKYSSIYQVSKGHSSFSNYTFLSIYNSSLVDHSFMALFKWHVIKKKIGDDEYQREYQEIISEKAIFGNQQDNLSWGIEDKIYRATDNGFEIVSFNNNAKKDRGQDLFTPLRNVQLQPWKGRVISGGVAFFGTIVECENALVVMLSNGENFTIPGAITRWRVYPRSHNYENHLHVIHDDRIEIYSFNQDYFLDQHTKIYGIEYKHSKHGRSESRPIFT